MNAAIHLAWLEGKRAKEQGVEVYDCPYPELSQEHYAWVRGWYGEFTP